ncbi:MAG: hypothetical protein BroJett018_21870 [Chloroflexota bacterium]|nr:MAG: hypothetical protein BroJett018_21870 [Chloroflexota bacterium]
MKRLTDSSPQLFVFLVLPLLVLLVGIAFGSITLHQRTMRETLVEHHKRIIPGIANNLSRQLDQRQTILQMWLESPSSTALPELEILFDGGIAEVKNGEVSVVDDRAVIDTAAFQEVFNTTSNSPFVPLLAPNKPELYIAILAKVDGNSAVGLVSLHSLPVAEMLASLHSKTYSFAYILDADNKFLYHNDPDLIGRTAAHPDEDSIVVSASVPQTEWRLVQEENWQKELSPLMRYSQAAPLVLVPGLLLTLLLVGVGIRKVVRPLQHLERQATSLDWGNYDAIEPEVGGIEEIQRLHATLRNMVQRIRSAQAEMHNYIGAVTRAQEEERLRLARELHDQTAQALVALNHQVQMLKPFLSDDPEAATLMSETRANITQSIEDLRRIVRALRPVSLEQLGLASALQMLARDLDLDDQMAIQFEKQGIPRRLSTEQEIVLYRIAQEALNNAWQHSGADRVWILVSFADDKVIISVRDNGHGFSAPQHPSEITRSGNRHFGIMGMYERAALIGAHLQIVSVPNGGTTITIQLPITTTSLQDFNR